MKPTLEELTQYVDGEVSATRRSQLELLIEQDAELASTIEALEASRLPIRRAYLNREYPALPNTLKEQTLNWVQLSNNNAQTLNQNKWSGFALSACLALALTIGYALGQWQQDHSGVADIAQHSDTQTIHADSLDHWARVVANYQSLYVRETVEHLTPAKETTGTTALANVKIPDFSAHGFEFVRSQTLGYQGQPLLQLVYLAEDGVPLALCIMPDEEQATALTRFTFESLNTGYWREAGNRYVLVGDIDNVQLEELQNVSTSI